MATGTRARRAGGAAPGQARTEAVPHGQPAPFSRARPGRRLLLASPAGPGPWTPGGPTPYGPASPSPHLSAAPALPGGPRSTGPGRPCPRPSKQGSYQKPGNRLR
ncbi:vegetative cell wall protein gp1 isoform X2 [Rhinolophus ferrumequinum]|uniref:vegetative cell wall protein gp1 isoform X2 n=1 Tax=Rhinolophus ferrumequinum TaxID=59479 RepID=UPI00140FD83E|nr:vegetative cell wall protein gp1 isoform X2 [Rhinolophus ferrumequinum]